MYIIHRVNETSTFKQKENIDVKQRFMTLGDQLYYQQVWYKNNWFSWRWKFDDRKFKI